MPTTKKQDAIALLKADHRKVEELFEKCEKARDKDRKFTLVQQILTELVVHAMVEEEIFYPACSGKVDEDLSDEAYVEHDAAKVIIAELAYAKPDDAFYDAKVSVLKEEIKHHVKEEERAKEGMFAQARQAGIDMMELAEQILARKEELLEQIKSDGLPVPKTRSFSGHQLLQDKPVDEMAA